MTLTNNNNIEIESYFKLNYTFITNDRNNNNINYYYCCYNNKIYILGSL